MEAMRSTYQILIGKPEGNGRIILKLVLEK